MNTNKRIIRALVVICLLFLSLMTYLVWFNMFQADEVASSPYNKRQWEDERYVKRGNIYSSEGNLLAETIVDGDSRIRNYPRGNLYCHIIGYYSQVYGKSELEMSYDDELMGKGDINLTINEMRSGYDLYLSVIDELQEYAYELMDGRRGAVVAMEPTTGQILAMVSLPDFDPNTSSLEQEWSEMVEQENSPFLPRATQGLYPPGSTYKIVTASAAYENGMSDEVFEDTGGFRQGDVSVDNYGGSVYGTVDVREAFIVSSNQVFCELGYELGADRVKSAAEKFGVNKEFSFDIPVSKSEIQYSNMSDLDAALVSIGQGGLVMTPLQVAMIGSSVANNGIMLQPYIVEQVVTSSGTIMYQHEVTPLYNVMSADCAAFLQDMMTGVVEERNGTGRSAQIRGIDVAGKTGTAETDSGDDHAWFVGYAPADDPKICVAVVLENDGNAGGTTAGPIARDVMRRFLDISGYDY